MEHTAGSRPAGPSADGQEFPELTVRQVSIFFTVYVFFQVWNQINCRSLTPEVSGFQRAAPQPDLPGDRRHDVLGQVLIVSVRRRGVQGGAARPAGLAGHRGLHGVGAGVRRGRRGASGWRRNEHEAKLRCRRLRLSVACANSQGRGERISASHAETKQGYSA